MLRGGTRSMTFRSVALRWTIGTGCGFLLEVAGPSDGPNKQGCAGLADLCRPAQLGQPGRQLTRRVVHLHHPILAAVAKPAAHGRRRLVGQYLLAPTFATAAVDEADPPARRQG